MRLSINCDTVTNLKNHDQHQTPKHQRIKNLEQSNTIHCCKGWDDNMIWSVTRRADKKAVSTTLWSYVYWHIFVLSSNLLSSIKLLTIYAIYILTCVLLVCVWAGGEGAYLILCVLCGHIYGFLHLDSTTSEPLEILHSSRFKPPVILPSRYPTKTIEGTQTLSKHPPVKGKCTCLVHVTHLLAP